MRNNLLILFFGLLGLCAVPEIDAREVTNADIQGAIMSLVHTFNLMDNKLERHEHRERALGEVMKRALQALQKGQKVYEPIKGIFSRLDERVSQIETMLIAQEEKYNAQSEKLTDTIASMHRWMTANAACDLKSSVRSSDEQTKLIEKIEKLSENVEDLSKSSQNVLDQTDKLIHSKLSSTDEVITKMEEKLSNFYITAPATPEPSPVGNPEFESKMMNYLDKIYDRIGELKNSQKSELKLSGVDKEFLEGLYNETQKSISDLKGEFDSSTKVLTETNDNIKNITGHLQADIGKITNSLADSESVADNFYSEVNDSISTLRHELDVFNKFDKVLLATSDYVLDTQRKVEYGTHQILVKVGDLIKAQNSDLNTTMQKRFDSLDETIIDNHKESLLNLSSVMETEISHVWRQIQIMHGEIAYSKDALEKLQGQTEAYVNGTTSTMDNMGGKVAQITGRMHEVDENLNYLLGRLSLVTQEFNQIKSGLGSALDQIRNSFQIVQDKIKDVGPGPHPITGEAEAK